MAQRVDLNDETNAQLLDFAKLNQAIENGFPIFVARKVVVGDKERVQAARNVGAHDAFDVVRRSPAGFAPLHVDDRAERALIRAAASSVEARGRAGRALYSFRWQQRNRRSMKIRQIIHEIVEWFQLTARGVSQNFCKATFSFAREK